MYLILYSVFKNVDGIDTSSWSIFLNIAGNSCDLACSWGIISIKDCEESLRICVQSKTDVNLLICVFYNAYHMDNRITCGTLLCLKGNLSVASFEFRSYRSAWHTVMIVFIKKSRFILRVLAFEKLK